MTNTTKNRFYELSKRGITASQEMKNFINYKRLHSCDLIDTISQMDKKGQVEFIEDYFSNGVDPAQDCIRVVVNFNEGVVEYLFEVINGRLKWLTMKPTISYNILPYLMRRNISKSKYKTAKNNYQNLNVSRARKTSELLTMNMSTIKLPVSVITVAVADSIEEKDLAPLSTNRAKCVLKRKIEGIEVRDYETTVRFCVNPHDADEAVKIYRSFVIYFSTVYLPDSIKSQMGYTNNIVMVSMTKSIDEAESLPHKAIGLIFDELESQRDIFKN